MLNRLFNPTLKGLQLVVRRGYQFPSPTSQVHDKPGLTAKRIILCVTQRLRQLDPDRWNSVPISFTTHWNDEGGYVDMETCIHVHDALERQFGIDIKDRQVLITDIETAFHVVNQHHDSI